MPRWSAPRVNDWSAGELERLRQLWAEGVDADDIATALGRTVDAVRQRRKMIGLPPRPRSWTALNAKRASRAGEDSRPSAAHEAAMRKCLGCPRTFRSSHPGNRLCSQCRQNIDRYGVVAVLRSGARP